MIACRLVGECGAFRCGGGGVGSLLVGGGGGVGGLVGDWLGGLESANGGWVCAFWWLVVGQRSVEVGSLSGVGSGHSWCSKWRSWVYGLKGPGAVVPTLHWVDPSHVPSFQLSVWLLSTI